VDDKTAIALKSECIRFTPKPKKKNCEKKQDVLARHGFYKVGCRPQSGQQHQVASHEER
jgi:hypothetical protein